MRIAALLVLSACGLALPRAACGQQPSDTATILREVLQAFRTGAVHNLTLRLHEQDPSSYRQLLRSLVDATTTLAGSRILPCAWPEENPPAGSGYTLLIRPPRITGDSAAVTVISACDTGADNGHFVQSLREVVVLARAAQHWQVVRRDIEGLD